MWALNFPALIGLLIAGASITGNGEALCKGMEGKWTPTAQATGGDVCPGGNLVNLFNKK